MASADRQGLNNCMHDQADLLVERPRDGVLLVTFNAAFIRVGLTGGDMGSSWLLPPIAGLGIANEPRAHRPRQPGVSGDALLDLGAACLELAVELENRNQALAAATSDVREALAAFMERRPAAYAGN